MDVEAIVDLEMSHIALKNVTLAYSRKQGESYAEGTVILQNQQFENVE
jgi:hypothetical protein